MSIVLEKVSYTYMPGTPYERVALRDVSLTVERGETVGIIGHTGSGKTTLVQHMNGLIRPTSGRVTVDGVDPAGKGELAKAARLKIGMVFQYPEHQLFEETVYEDVAFGPRNMGLPEEEVERRVRRALSFVGLDFQQFSRRSPLRLSGGQMRRVAIAGVIAMEPEFLVLDEPSASLDWRGREEIFREILGLHATTGIGIILVSHNMDDIVRLAKRVVVMHQGSLIADGDIREIFSRQGKQNELLERAGVEPPRVTRLMAALSRAGLEVEKTALTIDEAVEAIVRAVGRRRLA